jgi:hypothetical protein
MEISFKAFLEGIQDDQNVHKHVKDFHRDILRHPTFGKNALTAMHGKSLIDKGHEHQVEKQRTAGVPTDNNVGTAAISNVMNLMRIEAPYKADLEKEAIRLAAKHTGFPEDLFHAKLTKDMTQTRYAQMQDDDDSDENLPKIDQNMKHNVDRRHNIGLLSQGHALHSMDTMFADMDKKFKDVPSLHDAYKKLSLQTKGTYYYTGNIEAFGNKQNRKLGAVGECDVRENPETGRLEIYATAITFPFLLQELIKGAMEFTAAHTHNDLDDEQSVALSAHTNRFKDEPYEFLMGPQLWRYLVKALPPELNHGPALMDVVFVLSTMNAQESNYILRKMVEDMESDGKSPDFANKIATEIDILHEKRRKNELGEEDDEPEEDYQKQD